MITRGGLEFELPWEFWFADRLLQIFLVQGRGNGTELAVRKAAVTKFPVQIQELFSWLSHRRTWELFLGRQSAALGWGKRLVAGVPAVAPCGWEREQDLELPSHAKKQYEPGKPGRANFPIVLTQWPLFGAVRFTVSAGS